MSNSNHTQIPQGFSVYQPSLGSPLQFFPAIGSKELDDMLNAYLPGPSSVADKRATVSVDFFAYAQQTGQAFKFYAIPGWAASPVESRASLSPFEAPMSVSSINASPVASTWDWSAVSAPTPSVHASRGSRAASTTSSRRQTTTDFSNLPGMKILTKDGLDVTNSASRGSKTKEQRDHAHLMRIIKACESCKKKKIRCDPSHKKRSVAAPQPAKVTKKTKAPKPAVTVAQKESLSQHAPQDAFDFSLADFGGMAEAQPWMTDNTQIAATAQFDDVDIDSIAKESWEDFVNFTPEDTYDDAYDFFSDPQGFLLPQDAYHSSAVGSVTSGELFWDRASRSQSASFTSSPSDGSDMYQKSDGSDMFRTRHKSLDKSPQDAVADLFDYSPEASDPGLFDQSAEVGADLFENVFARPHQGFAADALDPASPPHGLRVEEFSQSPLTTEAISATQQSPQQLQLLQTRIGGDICGGGTHNSGGALQQMIPSSSCHSTNMNVRSAGDWDLTTLATEVQSRTSPVQLVESPDAYAVASASSSPSSSSRDSALATHAPHDSRGDQESNAGESQSVSTEFSRWAEYQQIGGVTTVAIMPQPDAGLQTEGSVVANDLHSRIRRPRVQAPTLTVQGRAPLSSTWLTSSALEQLQTQVPSQTWPMSLTGTMMSSETNEATTPASSTMIPMLLHVATAAMLASYSKHMSGKGSRKESSQESWLSTIGKLAVIPVATGLLSSFFLA